MTECAGCEREMLSGVSCGIETLLIEGVVYRRVRSDDEPACHDCGVLAGGVHHISCDREECPACGAQLLTCEHSSALRAAELAEELRRGY